MNRGIFTISLDFELHWGVMPRLSVKDYESNLKGTKESIFQTLDLFNKYQIHATWATVGFLFFEDKQSLKKALPTKRPKYSNSKYNPFPLLETIGETEAEAPYHLSPTLIDAIQKVPFQEMATHTFSHYFCLEKGQTTEEFHADLQAAIEIAAAKNITLKSIVFPRNQYNTSYLETCGQLGISNVRGNPSHFIYQPRRREEEKAYIRLLRLLDAYINLAGHQIQSIKIENGVCDIPASRFLRPYNSKLALLEKIRLRRIKKEMTQAAKQNKVYHLWWHPHNFGASTEKNMSFLEKILLHYKKLKQQYNFQSLNMEEIGLLYSSN